MCGIAGIISPAPTKFNKLEFNILGFMNDERGGDSCGVFIDGYTKYGIDKTAKFCNFVQEIHYPDKSQIAFVHCRKTSQGYKTTIEQAQPVIIYNKKGQIDFVLMHNGTIKNIKDLAKKYIPDFDIDNLSDSQIMAQIFYEKGYDVLEEYTGCAVFAIIDYRETNKHVLFFKGDSYYNPYNETSERPLYIMEYNGKFYFSSMLSPLKCINPNIEPLTITANKLCYLGKDMKLYFEKEYDRKKLTNTTYNYNYSSYGTSYNSYCGDYYLKYDSISGLYTYNGKPAHGKYNTYCSGYAPMNYSYGDNVYFYNGNLLWNKDCYDFLDKILGNVNETLFTNFQNIIDRFTVSPAMIDGVPNRVNDEFEYYQPDVDHWWTFFTGGKKYNLLDGEVSSENLSPYSEFKHFLEEGERKKFDFDSMEIAVYTKLFS